MASMTVGTRSGEGAALVAPAPVSGGGAVGGGGAASPPAGARAWCCRFHDGVPGRRGAAAAVAAALGARRCQRPSGEGADTAWAGLPAGVPRIVSGCIAGTWLQVPVLRGGVSGQWTLERRLLHGTVPRADGGPRRAVAAGEVEAQAGHRRGWTELPELCPNPTRHNAGAAQSQSVALSQGLSQMA